MPLAPTTDGEKIIQLDGKIDKLDGKIDTVCESIDRVVKVIENLELTRVNDHETRIAAIEKWQSEWRGVYRAISILALVGSVISIILNFTHHG